ncbi:hypothetical protein ACWGPW_23180 [Paenibacillus chitinolyticus]
MVQSLIFDMDGTLFQTDETVESSYSSRYLQYFLPLLEQAAFLGRISLFRTAGIGEI